MASDNGRRKDPGWKYNYLANVEDKNAVTCLRYIEQSSIKWGILKTVQSV